MSKEYEIISKIADRAAALLAFDKATVFIDISNCHENGCPLRLEDLLAADDVNFAHDICGINRNLNHYTYRLDNCFVPRFAKEDEVCE